MPEAYMDIEIQADMWDDLGWRCQWCNGLNHRFHDHCDCMSIANNVVTPEEKKEFEDFLGH